MALGFLLFVLALVAWIYTEDQKLKYQAEKLRAKGSAHRESSRRLASRGVGAMPRERQIEFPEQQTHSRMFEYACVLVAVICAVIAIIIEAF